MPLPLLATGNLDSLGDHPAVFKLSCIFTAKLALGPTVARNVRLTDMSLAGSTETGGRFNTKTVQFLRFLAPQNLICTPPPRALPPPAPCLTPPRAPFPPLLPAPPAKPCCLCV